MLENNRLIAKFMGHRYDDNRNSHSSSDFYYYEDSELEYNTSWDWLMEVVEKIEKTNLGSLEIQSKNLVLLQYNQKTAMYYNSTLIENVYNACVEFVKWYNNHTLKNTAN